MTGNYIHRVIHEEAGLQDPRKLMVLVKGCPFPVHMDTWLIEPHEEHGEDTYFLVDYTVHGDVRMVLRMQDVIAVKFYPR